MLVACGSGEQTGGCDTRTVNFACIDYQGPGDVVSVYRNACSPGTWLDTACPAAGKVTGCRKTDASLKLTYTTWSYPQHPGYACNDGTSVTP